MSQLIHENGNKSFVILEDKESWDEASNAFYEKTKWSDHQLGIPVLFNFYHGIELILKGFLANEEDIKPNHKISELLRNAYKNNPEAETFMIIEKYTVTEKMPCILQCFFEDCISKDYDSPVDIWYQALKYPEGLHNKTRYEFKHVSLMFHSSVGSLFYEELANDIEKICNYVHSRHPNRYY